MGNISYRATTGFLSNPSHIANLKLHKPYFIDKSKLTLCVDEDLLGIWINLDSNQFSERVNQVFCVGVQRVENGGKSDFKLLNYPNFKIVENESGMHPKMWTLS